MTADRLKPKINPDLQKERDTCTFDLNELADLLNLGPDIREKRRKICMYCL